METAQRSRVDWVVLGRLLGGTTFVPMFLGLVSLTGALDVQGGAWSGFLRYAGALLVALCTVRPYRDLDLRR